MITFIGIMRLKTLITLCLILCCSICFAQTYSNIGVTSWQRAPTSKGYLYRINLGSNAPGFAYWYTKQQIDSLNLAFALDANVVHKTGNETIGGVKTFSIDQIFNGSVVLGLTPTSVADASHGSISMQSTGGGSKFQFNPITGISKGPFNLIINSSSLRNYTLPITDGTLALTSDLTPYALNSAVLHNTGNESSSGNKTNSGNWSFGQATAPLLYTGNTNIAALSLVGFYNSAVNGNMLIGNNRSGSLAEIDFINAVGTSGSAIGGFRWSNVTTGGTEAPLLDINGSTKDITTYGRIFPGSVPASSGASTKYVVVDPTSAVLSYRTGPQTLSDITSGFRSTATLVAGVKAVTITGITTSSQAFLQIINPSGTSLTHNYTAICTANTLTITAVESDDATTNTSDVSTLNYVIIINP